MYVVRGQILGSVVLGGVGSLDRTVERIAVNGI